MSVVSCQLERSALSRQEREFMQQFEQASLPEERFDHEGHVHMAWLFLYCYGPVQGRKRFARAIMGYVEALGASDKYNETITQALLLLIASRMRFRGASDYQQFKTANGDIYADALGLLQQHYSKSRLFSEPARRRFIPPDLQPLPS